MRRWEVKRELVIRLRTYRKKRKVGSEGFSDVGDTYFSVGDESELSVSSA